MFTLYDVSQNSYFGLVHYNYEKINEWDILILARSLVNEISIDLNGFFREGRGRYKNKFNRSKFWIVNNDISDRMF